MSNPLYSPGWEGAAEGAPIIAGDAHDDDAYVLEQTLEQQPLPIDPAESNAVVVPVPDVKPTRQTRIISGYQTIDANTSGLPFMVAPADPDRLNFHMRVDGITTTDNVFVSDEENKLSVSATPQRSGISMRLSPSAATIPFDDYNGPVWIMGVTAGTLIVTWWSVVK